MKKILNYLSGGLLAMALQIMVMPAFAQKPTVVTEAGSLNIKKLAEGLDHPWGMAFLSDKRLLVTERTGNLRILDLNNNQLSKPLLGVPKVFNKGQGGLLDVALDPNFAQNKLVYLSYAEPGEGNTASTAVGRGRLEGEQLKDFKVIFSQEPKLEGPNHFGGRILFTPQGNLIVTLGERFKFDPAQNLSNHLGTIVRINPDGTVPQDNPFVNRPDAEAEIWSYGHRNIESAAIDPATNKLWVAEMGPMGGDEFNQPAAGRNYGWPVVSWGDNYDGSNIPDPPTHPEFADAVIQWTPTISPSGMIFYTGNMYPAWKGDALIGGLTSAGLVRVNVEGEQAQEVERIPLAVRTRDVEQGPDGAIYVLTDEKNGKVLKLEPLK